MLLINKVLHKIHHRRGTVIAHSLLSSNKLSFLIQNYCCRDGVGQPIFRNVAIGIYYWEVKVFSFQEVISPADVVINLHKKKLYLTTVLKFVVQLLDGRHLRLTRRTPCCPEVYKNYLTLKVSHMDRISFVIHKRYCRTSCD